MGIAKNILWTAALLLSAAALVTTTWLAYRDATLVIETAGETERSLTVLESLDNLYATLLDAQRLADDYLKTRQPAPLERFHATVNELKSQLSTLSSLDSTTATSNPRMQALTATIGNEVDRLRRSVQTDAATPDESESGAPTGLTQQAWYEQIAAMRAGERFAEKRREEHVLQVHLQNRLKHILAALLGAGGVLFVLFLLRREIALREKAAVSALFQRNWFRTIVRGIGDPVLVIDSESRISMLNASAEELCGIRQQDVVGKKLLDVLELHDEKTGKRLEKAVEGLDPGKQERCFVLHRPGGRRVTVEARTAFLGDPPSAAQGAVVVLRDATEQRKSASELSRASSEIARRASSTVAAERMLNTILENAPLGICVTGPAPDFPIVAASKQLQAWIGDATNMPAREAYRKLLPDGREPPVDLLPLNRVMVWGQRVRDERWLIERKNKERLAVLVNVAPVRDADDTIVGAVHCWLDLTEKQSMDRALRIMQSRFKILLEADVIGLILHFETNGKVAEANKVFLDMLGFDQEDLSAGKLNLIEQTPDEFRALDERAFAEVDEKGSCAPYEKEFFCKDATRRVSVIVGYAKVADAEGEYVGFALDLSVRKDLEHQLRRQAQELMIADQRKDLFLAMLAHELRNPLAPLRNVLHLLKTEGAANPKAVSEFLPMMQRQVDQLVRLVDDLLDAARISQGKIVLDIRLVDLVYALRAAVESVGPLIQSHRHRLKLSIPPYPLIVRGDVTRLTQIFANILHNAAKYTDAEGNIEVSVTRSEGYAEVRIRDDGKGIEADLLPHIFDPFVQDDRSLARSQGGLGIGLALAEKLCSLHEGSIGATSEGLGKGSEFVVRLPLADWTIASAPASTARSFPPHTRGQPKRVLVVDDNSDLARSTAALLEVWGHDSQIAADGPAAIEAARGFQPDVILLDIGLPGMDGFEVARHLRTSADMSEVPLVAVSGYGQKQDYARSLSAGFNAYLIKPVQPETLKILLDQISPHMRE